MSPARMLAIDTPGGFEAYYEELAAAFPGDTPGWSNEVLFLLFASGYAYFLLKSVISESLFHQPIVTP